MNMIPYIGTKAVKAVPMSRLAYNEYRGWVMPADENPADEGYLVEYLDGGKPCDDRHEGYISWSPKDVFERAYKPQGTWLDRVKAERDELQIKLDGLSKTLSVFPKPDAISDAQWILMPTQQFHMRMYLQTLEKRIAEAEGVDITLVERRTQGSTAEQFSDNYQIQTAQTNHALEHSLSQMNNSGLAY